MLRVAVTTTATQDSRAFARTLRVTHATRVRFFLLKSQTGYASASGCEQGLRPCQTDAAHRGCTYVQLARYRCILGRGRCQDDARREKSDSPAHARCNWEASRGEGELHVQSHPVHSQCGISLVLIRDGPCLFCVADLKRFLLRIGTCEDR